MTNYFYPLLFVFGFIFSITNPVHGQDDEEVFKVVEETPQFPGGKKARKEYLQENINYPKMARESGIDGTVYISFIVEPDGRLTNVEVIRGIGSGCDKETVRVVKNMPSWEPGKQKGKAVRVKFNMPVYFKLDDSPEKKRE